MFKSFRFVENYFRQTTVHGLRYIVDGTTLFERIVWLVCVVFVFGICSFLIMNALDDMNRSPILTTTEAVHISMVRKPAVSVNLPTCKS